MSRFVKAAGAGALVFLGFEALAWLGEKAVGALRKRSCYCCVDLDFMTRRCECGREPFGVPPWAREPGTASPACTGDASPEDPAATPDARGSARSSPT